MSLSVDGTSLIFTGQVTIGNATNPSAGIATLTLTPTGGVGNLPALLTGDPGLPPLLNTGAVTVLAPGATPTVAFSQTAAGGPGVASSYNVNFGIPQGATGTAGTNGTLGGCSDISSSPAPVVGAVPMVSTVSGSPAVATAFNWTPFPWGFVVNPASISSVAASGQSTQPLCSVSVPAQTFDWMPVVFANAIVVGTVNTVVQLQATLTAGSRVGDVVGQVSGYAGQATQALVMNSGFGGLVGPTQAYGEVTTGSTATIFLKAIQSASTPDNWSINNSSVNFTVVGFPVGP